MLTITIAQFLQWVQVHVNSMNIAHYHYSTVIALGKFNEYCTEIMS